jgi:hypothetical protein
MNFSRGDDGGPDHELRFLGMPGSGTSRELQFTTAYTQVQAVNALRWTYLLVSVRNPPGERVEALVIGDLRYLV